MIQGGGAQTVQIVRQVTTTLNQIKLIRLYKRFSYPLQLFCAR
ncbi:hypothetical protein [Candidatus Regiella insecticola]|nr:hypothetical protein [Candidatus Regiella insecticola]